VIEEDATSTVVLFTVGNVLVSEVVAVVIIALPSSVYSPTSSLIGAFSVTCCFMMRGLLGSGTSRIGRRAAGAAGGGGINPPAETVRGGDVSVVIVEAVEVFVKDAAACTMGMVAVVGAGADIESAVDLSSLTSSVTSTATPSVATTSFFLFLFFRHWSVLVPARAAAAERKAPLSS
jgi:hypothetical protein